MAKSDLEIEAEGFDPVKIIEDEWQHQKRDWPRHRGRYLETWNHNYGLSQERCEQLGQVYDQLVKEGANIIRVDNNLTSQSSTAKLTKLARTSRDGPFWVKKDNTFKVGPGQSIYIKKENARKRKEMKKRKDAFEILTRQFKESGLDEAPLLECAMILKKADLKSFAQKFRTAQTAANEREQLPDGKKSINPHLLRCQKDLVDYLTSLGMKKQLGAMDYAARLCHIVGAINSPSLKTIERHYRAAAKLFDSSPQSLK